nr:hypothetical protein Iba_chr08bCG1450 [Ipomoea batatas]
MQASHYPHLFLLHLDFELHEPVHSLLKNNMTNIWKIHSPLQTLRICSMQTQRSIQAPRYPNFDSKEFHLAVQTKYPSHLYPGQPTNAFRISMLPFWLSSKLKPKSTQVKIKTPAKMQHTHTEIDTHA